MLFRRWFHCLFTALFIASSTAWAVVGGIYDECFFATSGTARWEYVGGFFSDGFNAWAEVCGESAGMYGRGLVRCFFHVEAGTFLMMWSLHGVVVSLVYDEELR